MGRVIESGQQTYESALAGTCPAHDGNFFSRRDSKVNVREHRPTGLVFERDVPELDTSVQL